MDGGLLKAGASPLTLLAVVFLLLLSAFATELFGGFFLVLFFYFYPLLDRTFAASRVFAMASVLGQPPSPGFWAFLSDNQQRKMLFVKLIALLLVLFFASTEMDFSTVILAAFLIAAIPEEWFFRYYLQQKLGNNAQGIIVTSCLFSLSHGLSLTWNMALMVFPASVFFGYVFLKSRDFVLVILLHALSNLSLAWFIRVFEI